ncbi:Uncharacterised protein [Yersinia enterocolitica]|nr:Uncharacterised protein [Yersinia enterocolitica]
MGFVIDRPIRVPFTEQNITAVDFATFDTQPSSQTELSAIQARIVMQPTADPRFDVNIIGLHINGASI